MTWLINTTLRILEGLGTTLSVYLITIALSLPLGMLFGIAKTSAKKKWVLKALDAYTALFRGTPLLLQLFFVYFGLRGISFIAFGYQLRPFGFLGAFGSAALAFVLNYTAYFTEIFRGGIQAVDKGQYEAAKALGLSYPQSMLHVIIPQGIRSVLPAVANESITLVKDTALVAAIAMGDLLRNSKEIVVVDGNLMPFVIVAIIYLILSYGINFVFQKIEMRQEVKYS
ncbi:MAG: amino acid ABC transporter permease [Cellulosilyticaceae bacterium]